MPESVNVGNLVLTPVVDVLALQNQVARAMQTIAASAKIRVSVDTSQIQSQVQASLAPFQRGVSLKVKLDTAGMVADLQRIQGLAGRAVNINVRVTGTGQAVNDVNTLKALLASLQTNSNLRITTDVTALQAVNTQIATQVTQLTALIAQLRGLGGGGGAGGGPGSGLPSAVRATLLEVDRLNNLWTRGQISATNYNQALTAMQGRLEGARSAAGRGTEEFAAIDKQITKLTTSLRGINTDNLTKIRTDMAGVRTAFDAATGGISRNSQQFRDAAGVYQQGAAQIEARLRALAAQGNLTASQMGNLNRMLGTLAREQGTLSGGLNSLGLSGNIFNALRAGFPIIQQMGGSLGAAAMQGGMLAQGFGSASAAVGVMGAAVLGATAIVVGIGVAAFNTTKQFATFEHAMQGVKAVSDTTGKTFDGLKGQAAQLAQTFGVSLETVAAAQEELYKAGRTTEDVMGGATRGVIVLSKATGTDLLNAVSIANSSMNVFGLKGADMAMVADVIANGANKTALDVNTLGVSLQQVGNIASASGLSLQATVAILGMMADKGIAGSDAGTSLRTMLQRLQSPTTAITDALAKYNIQVYTAEGAQRSMIDVISDVTGAMNGMTKQQRDAFAITVFGTDAMRAINVMYSNGSVKLGEYVAKVDEKGRAEKDAATRAEGLTGAQDKLNASMQVFKTTVGELFKGPMLEAITGTLNLVNSATRALQNLRGGNVDLVEWGARQGVDTSKLSASDQNKAQIDLVQLRGLIGKTDAVSIANSRAYLQELEGFRQKIQAMEASTPGGQGFTGPLTPQQQATGNGGSYAEAGNEIGHQLAAYAVAGIHGATTSVAQECSVFVRQVFQQAFPKAGRDLFGATANATRDNFSKAGLLSAYGGNPSALKEGQVVFNKNDPSGSGHVGVVVIVGGQKFVAENSSAVAKKSATGDARALTPIANFGPITDVGDVNSYGKIAGSVQRAAPVTGADPVQVAAVKQQGEALYAAFKSGHYDVAALKAFQKAHKLVWAQIVADAKGAVQDLKDAGLSDADWAKYKTRATELAGLQDKRSTLSQPQALKLDRDVASFDSDPVKAKALQFASQQLSDQKALAAQNKTLSDQATAESKRVQSELARGNITNAQTALERLRVIQQQELDSVGDSQAKRLSVVKRTSQQIYEGEMALARVTGRDALAAANAEKDPALRSAKTLEANNAYGLADQRAKLARIEAVSAAQKSADSEKRTSDEASRALIVEQANFERQVNRDLSAGKISSAQAGVRAQEQARQTALTGAKGQAAAELKIEQDRGVVILAAQLSILAKQRDAAVQSAHDTAEASRAAADKTYKGEVPQKVLDQITGVENAGTIGAKATYTADASSAQEAQAGRIASAQGKVRDAIKTTQGAYGNFGDTLRQFIRDGTLEGDVRQKLIKGLNEQATVAKLLGVYDDPRIKATRAHIVALLAQADAAYLTSQRMVDLNRVMDDSEGQHTRAADAAVTLATGLQDLGQNDEALQVLQDALTGVMDAAGRGEVVGQAMSTLAGAIGTLSDSLNLQTEVNDWLATLDGSIDDQLTAIQAKLEDPTVSVPFKKLLSGVQLGGAATPGAQMGDGALKAVEDQGYRNIGDAAVLVMRLGEETGSQLQTAITDAVAYLGSAVGQTLPGEVNAAIQAGIDGAKAGMASLSEVLADPSKFTDGAQGLKTAPESPDVIIARQDKLFADTQSRTAAHIGIEQQQLEWAHTEGLISQAGYISQRQLLAEQGARTEFETRTRGLKESEPAYKQAEEALQAALTAAAAEGTAARKGLQNTEASNFLMSAQRRLTLAQRDGGNTSGPRGEVVSALGTSIAAARAELAAMNPLADGYQAKLTAIWGLEDQLRDVRLSATLVLGGFDTGMVLFQAIEEGGKTFGASMASHFAKVAEGSESMASAVGASLAEMTVHVVDQLAQQVIATEAAALATDLLSGNWAKAALDLAIIGAVGAGDGLFRGLLTPSGSPTIQDPASGGRSGTAAASAASSAPAIQYNLTMENTFHLAEGLDSPGTRQKLAAMQEQTALRIMDRAGLIKLPASSPVAPA